MADKVTEALIAKPLPDMIKDLGLAVATANAAMASNPPSNRTVYTIDHAEIEVKIALSMATETELGLSAGASIYAFAVNASYARSYSFKEEASSSIKLTMRAVPTSPPSA